VIGDAEAMQESPEALTEATRRHFWQRV